MTSFPGCPAVVNQMVGEVIPTRAQLTFSQCQNFIADISLERNYTYFFWGHSDVALLASSPEKGFAEEVTETDTDKQDSAGLIQHFLIVASAFRQISELSQPQEVVLVSSSMRMSCCRVLSVMACQVRVQRCYQAQAPKSTRTSP